MGVGLRLTALFAVFMIACGGVITAQLFDIDETARRLRLREQAENLRPHIRIDASGMVKVDLPATQTAIYGSPEPQRFYAVSNNNGDLLATSQQAIAAHLQASLGSPFRLGDRDTPVVDGEDQAYFLHTQAIDISGVRLLLTVGHCPWTSDRLLREVERALLQKIAWMALPLGMLTFAVSILVVRKELAPVEVLSRQAEAIGPSNPGQRLGHPDVPEELTELVDAANGATERLETAASEQRRFTSEAAHQLLTPLAILSARLELGRQDEIGRDLARMERLIRQLLALSRVTACLDVSERTDLRSLAAETVAELAPLAIAEGKDLAFDAPPGACEITGMPHLLEEALSNLIQNGLQHSPPGGCVEVEVRPPGTVTVSDCGPGLPADLRSRLFEPFVTSRGASGGSGLGLALVAEVMQQHGGKVMADNRPGGGAVFILQFREEGALGSA